MKSLRFLLVFAFCLVVGLSAVTLPINAQNKSSTDRDLNLREYVELLRADLKAQRVGMITQIMQFDDAEAAAFWPIFREYDLELTKIGDGRVKIIEEYVNNYSNMTDEKADQLMTQALELEKQRAELKKTYFDKIKTATSAVTAARFFQVENQIQYLIDLQISASLPTMPQAAK